MCGSLLGVSLWYLIGVLSVSVIPLVSALLSRSQFIHSLEIYITSSIKSA
jgi:hypothetical protein